MPYSPAQPLVAKAEIKINGVWVTVTGRTRSAGGVWVKHGQSAGANRPETSRCRVAIGNDDAWLTEENPDSPWWPHIGRGTPLRLSLTGILPSDAYRFTGEIDLMEAVYPGGASSAMEIEAIGTWGVLEQNDDPLHSALRRSVLSSSPQPIFYVPLEDGIRATTAASGLAGGQPMTGNIVFQATDGPPGSDKVVSIRSGGEAWGQVIGCGTAWWTVEHVALWADTDTPAANSMSLQIDATGGTISSWRVSANDSPDVVQLSYLVPPSSVYTALSSTEPGFNGEWKHIIVELIQSGPDITVGLSVNGTLVLSSSVVGQTMGAITRVGLGTFEDVPAGEIPAVGHITVWSGAAVTVDTPTAAFGWDGELVHERIARLAAEEGITVAVVGESAQQMGPQRIGQITELFTDCQDVDQGLWSDDRTDIGLVYRTQSHLYTQAAQVAVTKDALTPDTTCRWDYQGIRNEWTVTRDGGSSATQSDEDHVARIHRRVKGSAILRIFSDEFLDHHARWRVNLTTPPGPRYQSLGLNMRNIDAAALADAVLATEVGDRLTASEQAFPSQHPPGGANQLITGWEELVDADIWEFRPVTRPYRPYELVGRWALLSHELHAAIDSSVTSIDVANTDISQPMLATEAADVGSGYGITIGGEKLLLTAVAASTVTFGATGGAAHAVNASVTPTLPASTAAGHLLLILAAIRNSGAGVPQAPTGYTRLPVFPDTSNVQVFGKIAGAGESNPTVTFSGGVANADTSATIIRLTGKWHDVNNIVVDYASRLNPSAQDILVPGLPLPVCDDCVVFGVAWKQDDWTSVAQLSGFNEINEPDTVTGDDQGIVWDYVIQTTATSIASQSFVVTGGVGAISRSAIFALRCDYQTATVTRGVDGSTAASHAAGDDVTMTDPMRWGLL